MSTNICDICLSNNENLEIINENSKERDSVIEKLRKLVPEVVYHTINKMSM